MHLTQWPLPGLLEPTSKVTLKPHNPTYRSKMRTISTRTLHTRLQTHNQSIFLLSKKLSLTKKMMLLRQGREMPVPLSALADQRAIVLAQSQTQAKSPSTISLRTNWYQKTKKMLTCKKPLVWVRLKECQSFQVKMIPWIQSQPNLNNAKNLNLN